MSSLAVGTPCAKANTPACLACYGEEVRDYFDVGRLREYPYGMFVVGEYGVSKYKHIPLCGAVRRRHNVEEYLRQVGSSVWGAAAERVRGVCAKQRLKFHSPLHCSHQHPKHHLGSCARITSHSSQEYTSPLTSMSLEFSVKC